MSFDTKQDNIEVCIKHVHNFFDTISVEYEKIGTLPELVSDHFKEMSNHIKEFLEDLTEQIRDQRLSLEVELDQIYSRYMHLVDTLREDVVVQKNLMPLIKMIGYLKSEVKKLDETFKQNVNHVKRLNAEMSPLCVCLNVEPKKLPLEPLPTKKQIEEFSQEFEYLQNRKYSLLEDLIAKKDIVTKLANELNYKPENEAEKNLIFGDERSFILSQDNFDKLSALSNKLEHQMIVDKQYLETLRIQLRILSKCLDLSEEEKLRELERNSHDMLLCQKIDVHLTEIEKCENIKKENYKKYLHEIRSRILDYWLKCFYGDKQRKEFAPFYESEITDEIVKLHEDEIVRLINYYEKNKHIFDTFNKWHTYWEKNVKLNESTANGVNRYQNRGCTLLQEERQRNLVEKKLQVFEEKLIKEAKEYEAENHRPLVIHDKNVIELIRTKVDDFKCEKENRLMKKKLQRLGNSTMSTTNSANQLSKFSTPQQRILRPHLGSNLRNTPASQKIVRAPRNILNTPKSVDSKLTKMQHDKRLRIPKRNLVSAMQKDGHVLLFKGKRMSGTFDSKMKQIRRSKNRNSLLEYSKFMENLTAKQDLLNSTPAADELP